MLKSLKRWPVLLALLVAVGVLAVGLVFLPGNRVTRENCERIHEGMTEAAVRAILGKPWDDELLDPDGPDLVDVQKFLHSMKQHEIRSPQSGSVWMGSDVGIYVAFDSEGRVVFTTPLTDPDRPRSWLPGRVWRRLRARYGW
jgi:hypothetical protein